MGWDTTSFVVGDTVGVTAKLNAVYSDFWSLAKQESGAPPIAVSSLMATVASFGSIYVQSGIVAPQTNSFGSIYVQSGIFGTLNVSSEYRVRGTTARLLVQDVFTQVSTLQVDSAQTYITYIVASLTPVFSDSVIKVRGSINGTYEGRGTNAIGAGVANLCRAPNGTPIVLTDSTGVFSGAGNPASPVQPLMGAFAAAAAGVNGERASGSLPFTYQESNMNGGVALQYGIRFRVAWSQHSGAAWANRAELLIEEWR